MKKLFTLIAILFTGYMASASCTASYTTSISGLNVTFTNTSTPPVHTGAMHALANWNFGDGGYSSSWNTSHTYAATGSYTITLYVEWVDSATSTYLCDDTLTSSVSVTSPTGISGTIIRDSALGPVYWDSLMVWLITYDTATHIITAVDSQRLVAPGSGHTPYSFTGVTPGSYLVKAAGSFGGTGSGFVPTYHYSSLSWSTAGYVSVTSGAMSTSEDIYMQYGTLTSGPGFIAGNVLYGAGKTTYAVGDPVIGLTIYLVNNTTGKLIAATVTDATGKYSFNVPYGTYTIYPEHAGLLTTAWTNVTVSATAPTMNAVSFKENSKTIVPHTSAVPQVTKQTNISMYPNPAHNVLTIECADAANQASYINITDVAGRKILTTSFNTAKTNVNISGLQPGLYFVNILSRNTTYNQKLTIQ